MTVKQLILDLQKLPNTDKEIITQVIAEDGTVWNCFFDFQDTKSRFVQLRISHPEMKTLKGIECCVVALR